MRFVLVLALLIVALPLKAQFGCGNTLTSASPLCQHISLGNLSKAWTVVSRHGEYTQSETECFTPSQVNVANGFLQLTTIAQSYTCGDFLTNGSVRDAPSSFPYTTGQVQFNTFSFTFGTINFRTKTPASATNIWPSHWLLGSNCQTTNKFSGDTGFGGCPNLGASQYTEIDMLECYNSGGWCQFHVANPNFGIGNGCDITFSVDTNWHTYSVVWASSSIKLLIDGSLATTCTQSMSNPMFMIILIQTGGVGGTPSNGNLPASSYTDYVQIVNPNGQTIFFDDFQPPVPPTMLRPVARLARFVGSPLAPGAVGSILNNSVMAGPSVMRLDD